MHIQQFLTLLKCHYTYKSSKSSDIILDQSNPIIKLNTFASYIKLYVDAVTNNAYLDYKSSMTSNDP